MSLLNTIQSLLDTISSTMGSILYRGSTTWQALLPGGNGNVLLINNSVPSWGSASVGIQQTGNVIGTATTLNLGSGTNVSISNGVATITASGGGYHDVTSLRAVGTVYTNIQSNTIYFAIDVTGYAGATWNLLINGTSTSGIYMGWSQNSQITIHGFANPGDTYELTVSGGSGTAMNHWRERY